MQWISPVLAVAAVMLGASVDVQSLLPLRPLGRAILLIACVLLALAVSKQIGSSTRRLTAVVAAMTVLLMITLWFGYQERSAPTADTDTTTTNEDIAELLQERNDDAFERLSRDSVRVVTSSDFDRPDWQLVAGQTVRLNRPMEDGRLHLDAGGQLVGYGLRMLVRKPAAPEWRLPCGSIRPALFQPRVPLARLHVGTVLCLRTASHDGHLIVTNRSWSAEPGSWLEFQIVT